MSSCYICENPMESIHIDPRDKKTKPCSECEEIIQENLESLIRRFEAKNGTEDDLDYEDWLLPEEALVELERDEDEED